MIKIIIDSTCDIDNSILKENQIEMIPLQVAIEDISKKDKVEISVDDVYLAIEENKSIKTSLPLYEDIYKTFEKIVKNNDKAIFITFSKEMSGTYNFSKLVLEDIKEVYKDADIRIIDSKNGGIGITLLLNELLSMNLDDSNIDEIESTLNNLTLKTQHAFLANDLEQLIRGGRLSTVKGFIANLLKIKPLIVVKDGIMAHYKSPIGIKRGIRELITYVEEHITNKDEAIGVSYTNDLELADLTVSTLEKSGFTNIIKQRIGSVMTAHIGLSAVGIAFLNK